MKKINSGVTRILSRIIGPSAIREQEAIRRWNDIVGEQIAENAIPRKSMNGTLYVSVSSSVWRQELMMRRLELLELIGQHIGKGIIRDIRFQ